MSGKGDKNSISKDEMEFVEIIYFKEETMYKKRFFAVLIALIMMFSALPLTANAATKAKFGSNSYCTVTLNNSVMKGKYNKKAASVVLNSYNVWKTDATVTVTLRDQNGRYIWSGQMSGKNKKINLGNDHKTYRIYVNAYTKPYTNSWNSAWNFKNKGKCDEWRITNNKNCSIK